METEEITSEDVFAGGNLDDVITQVNDLTTRFRTHNHDGRNSLEINAQANARNIRLLSLFPISDRSDGDATIESGTASKTISNLVIASDEAKATTSTAHGLSPGDSITVAGANHSEFNGTFTAYPTSTTTLKYVVTSTLNSVFTISSLTRISTTATAVTSSAHGFLTGDTVTVSGANQSGFNGQWVITVTNSTTFTYTVLSAPTSPSTGASVIFAKDGGATITVTVPLVTTLTRDMSYDHLIVKNGGIINTASFRIFADIIEINGGGKIRNNGYAGGCGGIHGDANTNGSAGAGGNGGTAIASGSLPGSSGGGSGGTSGTSGGGNGNVGSAGSDLNKSLGTVGVGGGPGATTSGAGGNGGNGGSQIGTVYNVPRSLSSAYYLLDTQPISESLATISSITFSSNVATVTTATNHGLSTGDSVLIEGATQNQYNGLHTIQVTSVTVFTFPCYDAPTSPATTSGTITGTIYRKNLNFNVTAGSGGGGGGGNQVAAPGGSPRSGGGGGAGGAGGLIEIFARQIINAGAIEVKGGPAGHGGNADNSYGGGGGGGGGGSGGVVILVYGDLSGSGVSDVSGGAAGAAGTNTGGNPGTAGTAGGSGNIFLIKLSAL